MTIPEGGDQLGSNLAILMAPISLLDVRMSQWSSIKLIRKEYFPAFAKTIRVTSLIVIWVQISLVYFFAAVEKFSVEEWRDGTALFYWASDPNFGATGFRLHILNFFAQNSLSVVILTWGVLFLELVLAFSWMASNVFRRYIFIIGLLFHLGISFFMGLISFGFIMCGALVIYLGLHLSGATLLNTKDLAKN